MVSGGRGPKDNWFAPAGHEHMSTVEDYYGKPYAPPRKEGEPAGDGVGPRPFVADGDDLALLGFFLGRIGKDDAAGRFP